MSTIEAFAKSIAAAIAVGFATLINGEAWVTFVLAFALALFSAWATYRVAIRQVKREIREAFTDHLEKMHKDHSKVVEEVNASVDLMEAVKAAAKG